MIVILMGVTGTGKTTVGKMLAERTGWPFHDADDFHSPASVEKMRSGIPLTDDDRWPWLDRLNALLRATRPRASPPSSPARRSSSDTATASSRAWKKCAGCS